MLNGLDIMVLLKLASQEESYVPSKRLAEELSLEPSEITRSLKRCRTAGLVHSLGKENRVNRTGLLEFLIHGLRYVFPAQRGSMTRGVPTSVAAAPWKALFVDTGEPPLVWPYAKGTVRGIALAPLHKRVPEAALHDPRLYEFLTLVDAMREGRARERQLAKEELTERLGHDA